MNKIQKIRRSQEQWESLLLKFEQSEFSAQKFCQVNGIAESTFYKWRNKLGDFPKSKDQKELSTIRSPFLELVSGETSLATSSQEWMIELSLGSDCVLRIRQPN